LQYESTATPCIAHKNAENQLSAFYETCSFHSHNGKIHFVRHCLS